MKKQICSFLESRFKLSESGTNVQKEVLGGVVTFLTMAYILGVNPQILSACGMDKAGVFVATAVASAFGCFTMAILANYPFALAPGMGLNAFFAFSVVLGMGYSWQTALTAVFIEGVIFLFLSLSKVRDEMVNVIPYNLKIGVSAGIGLFIAFIGLQSSKIVVSNPATMVGLYDFSTNSFAEQGITVLLALIGVIIIGLMMINKVKGAILWGVLLTWGIGVLCELTGCYIPNPELGTYSVIPNFTDGWHFSAISNNFMQFEFVNIASLDFAIVVFAFFFVDLFDTMGTLVGVSVQAKMLDKEGKLPRMKEAFVSDSLATIAGSVLGVSTTTTYVESTSGVTEGARTGLASLVTGGLFLISLILAPIFLALPAFATSPALIIVGLMMLKNVQEINFDDIEEALPAYISAIAMPFCYSIADGICLGVISYVSIKLALCKDKDVHPFLAILAAIFAVKYALL